jgi:hypothetical protein
MLINMLNAVSKILESAKSEKRVKSMSQSIGCAKSILDEVIKSVDSNCGVNTIDIVKVVEEKKVEKKSEDNKYKAIVDNGKLISIDGFPETGIIVLDGKRMPYSEAKGKPFQTIEIL